MAVDLSITAKKLVGGLAEAGLSNYDTNDPHFRSDSCRSKDYHPISHKWCQINKRDGICTFVSFQNSLGDGFGKEGIMFCHDGDVVV